MHFSLLNNFNLGALFLCHYVFKLSLLDDQLGDHLDDQISYVNQKHSSQILTKSTQ